MREIKFRAFTGEEMVILENSGLQYFDFEGSYSLGFTVDGYTGFWAHEQYDSVTEKSNKYPIMHYTGLKDKNGVEIYEGDIVNSNYFKNATVVFWRYGWHFNTGKDNHHSFNTASHSFEVIGNIHENPELLEQPKVN